MGLILTILWKMIETLNGFAGGRRRPEIGLVTKAVAVVPYSLGNSGFHDIEKANWKYPFEHTPFLLPHRALLNLLFSLLGRL
jgi:hypothetical protein